MTVLSYQNEEGDELSKDYRTQLLDEMSLEIAFNLNNRYFTPFL